MSAITESARGEECLVRLECICNRDPATVVFAHGNGSAYSKGFGQKAPDYLGAYCCSACHDVFDRRVPVPLDLVAMSRWEVELSFAHGVFRTQRKLVEKGLLVCAGC